MKRFLAVAAVAAGVFYLVGCGDNGKPTAVPGIGKVVFKKKDPAAGALIVFHPVDPELEKRIGGKPFAKVGDDGAFKLTSYNEGDGAPEGEYGVTVQWLAAAKDSKFSLGGEGGGGRSMINEGKYGNPAKPFIKVTVKKGEPNRFDFDVD